MDKAISDIIVFVAVGGMLLFFVFVAIKGQTSDTDDKKSMRKK